MCGICGWTSKNVPGLFDLQVMNAERGGYSTGILKLGDHTPSKFPGTVYSEEESCLVHWRAPTTGGSNSFKPEENHPLEYKGRYLMGNGVITRSCFESMKDEDNNNDLYYVLKKLVNEGIESISQIEGVFALVFVDRGKVFLIRNTFPLYATPYMFSSVMPDLAHDGYKGQNTSMEEGVWYEWYPTFRQVTDKISLYSPYIMY